MTTIMVCDRWELPISEDFEEEDLGKNSYLRYMRRPQAGKTALCKDWLMSSIKAKLLSVAEYFGGVGVFSTIIQNRLEPKEHYIFENDQPCFYQLTKAFGDNPTCKVILQDAKDAIGEVKTELAVLDFPSFTVYNFEEWEPQFRKLFEQGTLGVVWLDTAGHYVHLHRKLYSELLGEPIVNIHDYRRAFSNKLFREYGYSIAKIATASGCSYNIAVAGEVPEIEVMKVGGRRGLVFRDDS